MSIGKIGPNGINTVLPRLNETASTQDSGTGPSFGEALTKALADVNQAQLTADDAAVRLASGQASSLQEVVLATEKASLALQFTMAIRNKVLDAYNDIMRMPV